MYKIVIDYKTGNSFKSYYTSDEVELTWENLDIAKINLKRLKEHYIWYEDNDRISPVGVVEPEWRKGKKISKETLILLTDDEKEYVYYPFWFGYFERLRSAKIETDSSDMEFYV